jgi:hypothetical protein
MSLTNIDPPVREEDGSTAKTATLCPLLINIEPKDSINELLPTPGAPDNPILKLLVGILTISDSSIEACFL